MAQLDRDFDPKTVHDIYVQKLEELVDEYKELRALYKKEISNLKEQNTLLRQMVSVLEKKGRITNAMFSLYKSLFPWRRLT